MADLAATVTSSYPIQIDIMAQQWVAKDWRPWHATNFLTQQVSVRRTPEVPWTSITRVWQSTWRVVTTSRNPWHSAAQRYMILDSLLPLLKSFHSTNCHIC